MGRLVRLVAGAMLFALPAFAAPSFAADAPCKSLTAPDIPNCTKIGVPSVAKSYLDLYKIDAGKAVLQKSVKSDEICTPFQATDCKVPAYLMVETPEKERLLFRRSDLKSEASASDCVCPRSAQNTVIGAPGAGHLKECAPELCH